VAVAGAVVLAIPDVLSEQVEDVDFSIVRFGFGPRVGRSPILELNRIRHSQERQKMTATPVAEKRPWIRVG